MAGMTIKVRPELRARIAAVAKSKGITAHAFMVNAVEDETTRAEKRRSFVADALASQSETLRTGKGYSADEVHAYFRARIAGKKAARPKARSWRR